MKKNGKENGNYYNGGYIVKIMILKRASMKPKPSHLGDPCPGFC